MEKGAALCASWGGRFHCPWGSPAPRSPGARASRRSSGSAAPSLLVAYWTYSGVRVIRTRERGPQVQDGVASIAGLAAVAGFCYWLPQLRVPWVPMITYSTLGALALVAVYDLARFSNREISSALGTAEGTVKNHASSILSKLGVRDRTRAVLKALELGYL